MWIYGTAIGAGSAWTLGMLPSTVISPASISPWTGSRFAAAATIYLICAVAGGTVGAIHGSVLRKLLRTAQPAEDLRTQPAA